jgi:hypothetical protein
VISRRRRTCRAAVPCGERQRLRLRVLRLKLTRKRVWCGEADEIWQLHIHVTSRNYRYRP